MLIQNIRELEFENEKLKIQLFEGQKSTLMKEENLLKKIKELEEENLRLNQNLHQTLNECEKYKSRAEDLLFDVNKKTEEVINLHMYKEQAVSSVNILLRNLINYKMLNRFQ